MAGPLDYWSKLLTGDSKATSEALAPTAATISKQFGAAERQVDTGAVRGGARSGQLAELPFAQAAKVGTAAENLQGDAAKNIISTLQGIAGIGTAQEGVGLGEQGIGLQQLLGSLNALMQRRGQNVAQDTANIGAIGSGLGDLLGGIISKLPSFGGGG